MKNDETMPNLIGRINQTSDIYTSDKLLTGIQQYLPQATIQQRAYLVGVLEYGHNHLSPQEVRQAQPNHYKAHDITMEL